MERAQRTTGLLFLRAWRLVMRLSYPFRSICRRWFSPRPAPSTRQGDRPSRGLYLLAVVQAGERFAFVGFLPLFVLYLEQRHGLSEQSALLTFGIFQSLSYLCALPAGILADRALGPTAAALLGGGLLTLGYGALALDVPVLLWPALGVMVLGHGFFKPGICALASSLSGSRERHREYGFLLLHLAVNVGGLAGPLCAERARAVAGWTGMFRWATAGMFLSLLLLAVGSLLMRKQATRSQVLAPVGISLGTERERGRAVWLICGVTLVFWLTAQQAGSSLSLFAEQHTVQHLLIGTRLLVLGPGHFASLHAGLVLLLVPPLLWGTASLRCRRTEPSTPVKMIWGYVTTAAAFAVMGAACLTKAEPGRVGAGWLSGCYLLLSGAEVLLAPLGLSLVTRLTPPHRLARTVGLWFGSVALGSGLTGVFGFLWGRWPGLVGHARYFALLAALSLVAAALLVSRLRKLERLLATEVPKSPA